MRIVVFVALVACTAPTAAPRDAAPDGAWRPDAAVDAPAFSMQGAYVPVIAVRPAPPRLPALEPAPPSLPERASAESRPAIHGTTIANVAVTDDGKSAVTVDAFGAVRLWPTLDGKVEPVAVTASHPAQLAIARDGDHFVIAALDRGGSLEFLTVKPTGASLWHARIDETRPFSSIAATLVGFIAITDDQRIAVFSLDGAPRGHLVPDPGEHVVGLVHRGVRALALVKSGGAIHGRWVTNDGWAGTTPRLRIDPSHAALTPDGARIAASTDVVGQIAFVATETGKVVETMSTTVEDTRGGTPIGFVDGMQLAVGDSFALAFAHDGALGPWVFGDDRERPLETVVGDGVVLVPHGASLAVATPAGAKILGYKLAMPTELRMLDHGALITDGASLVRIDDRFAERERYALPPEVSNIVPLDTHHALAFARGGNAQDLVAIDLDDPDATKILVHDAYGTLGYQPATHLYAVVARTHVAVGRFDPRTSTFDGPIDIPLGQPSAQILLPERGVPLVISELRPNNEEIEVREVAKLDFAKHAFTANPSHIHKQQADGFWRQSATPPTGLHVVRGALVADLAQGRITLRDGDAIRWVVPSHGIGQLAWTARGELVARGNGLVHLALATGAFAGAHCGYGFGLWDEGTAQATRFPSGLETVCDVE